MPPLIIIKNCMNRYIHSSSSPKNTVINLLGNQKNVDKASWEIKSFAVEKSLHTANIVYDTGILQSLVMKNNFFIVNRCYYMNWRRLLYLKQEILKRNETSNVYNLFVFNTTNRFYTNHFIQTNKELDMIVYPLAAPKENKRRDIHILIDF